MKRQWNNDSAQVVFPRWQTMPISIILCEVLYPQQSTCQHKMLYHSAICTILGLHSCLHDRMCNISKLGSLWSLYAIYETDYNMGSLHVQIKNVLHNIPKSVIYHMQQVWIGTAIPYAIYNKVDKTEFEYKNFWNIQNWPLWH